MKTITLFKSLSKSKRDEKYLELKEKFSQFQVYVNMKQTKFCIQYEVKASGLDKDVEIYLQSQKQIENSPIQIIIDLLKIEMEPLRILFLEKTKEWAIKEYNSIIKDADLPWKEYYLLYKKDIVDVSLYSKYEYKKNILKNGIEVYLEKAKDNAENHYQNSIIKLADRISKKSLDINKLSAITKSIDVNISTTLTDGEKSVTAWTIIASGEIQCPHYRYLVK